MNGRGLDLRLRLPDWIEGLEPVVRAALQKGLDRGSVSLTLKVHASSEASEAQVSQTALDAALSMVAHTEDRAQAAGVSLRPTSAGEVLNMRGVIDAGARDTDTSALRKALEADVPVLLADLKSMRDREGGALEKTILGQLDQVAALQAAAQDAAQERGARATDVLKTQVARVLDATDSVEPERLAQELALLAVKADITEELDRLSAHIDAARDLLSAKGPKGRKLDFLTQEFNREANTICSKAGSAKLTSVGLDLKAVIDQMREQVQNVE